MRAETRAPYCPFAVRRFRPPGALYPVHRRGTGTLPGHRERRHRYRLFSPEVLGRSTSVGLLCRPELSLYSFERLSLRPRLPGQIRRLPRDDVRAPASDTAASLQDVLDSRSGVRAMG